MRALFFAALAAATSFAFLACSGSDDAKPTNGAQTGDSGTHDGSSTGTTPGSSACNPDAGDTCAPNGCKLKSTDYRVGKKAENIARTDAPAAVAWTTPENALSEDGKFATVSLSDGQESQTLRISDFGMVLPDNDHADTWGVEVDLKRRAPAGNIADVSVNLDIPNKPTQFKFFEPPWPVSIVGEHHYAQPTDTWMADIFPSDFVTASFGATISVKRAANAPAGPIEADIEFMKVAVWFCPK